MKTDIVILGGGMVGLSLARQILNRGTTNKITIIDKEKSGVHSSGRNSGVLHVCSITNQIVQKFGEEKDYGVGLVRLPINCGKVVVPQRLDQILSFTYCSARES